MQPNAMKKQEKTPSAPDNSSTTPSPCPRCGHCPTCGRGGAIPYDWPSRPWVWPSPLVYSGTGTTDGYGQVITDPPLTGSVTTP